MSFLPIEGVILVYCVLLVRVTLRYRPGLDRLFDDSEEELYLYTCGAPLYEVGQLAFTDALQALVHLSRVYLTLHARSTPLRPVRAVSWYAAQ